MKVNFEESSFLGTFVEEMRSKKRYLVGPEETIELSKAIIVGTAVFLANNANKESETVLRYNDLKGNLIIANVLSYEPAEDAKLPGNWEYRWTFNEDDIKDAISFTSSDKSFLKIMTKTAFAEFGLTFVKPEHIIEITSSFFKMLKDELEINATSEDDPFILEFGEFFIATSKCKGEEKILGFAGKGIVKQYIKNDELASSDVEE